MDYLSLIAGNLTEFVRKVPQGQISELAPQLNHYSLPM